MHSKLPKDQITQRVVIECHFAEAGAGEMRHYLNQTLIFLKMKLRFGFKC